MLQLNKVLCSVVPESFKKKASNISGTCVPNVVNLLGFQNFATGYQNFFIKKQVTYKVLFTCGPNIIIMCHKYCSFYSKY